MRLKRAVHTVFDHFFFFRNTNFRFLLVISQWRVKDFGGRLRRKPQRTARPLRTKYRKRIQTIARSIFFFIVASFSRGLRVKSVVPGKKFRGS